jgi:hypothetical protein
VRGLGQTCVMFFLFVFFVFCVVNIKRS